MQAKLRERVQLWPDERNLQIREKIRVGRGGLEN